MKGERKQIQGILSEVLGTVFVNFSWQAVAWDAGERRSQDPDAYRTALGSRQSKARVKVTACCWLIAEATP